ncbi:bifunctional diguanylate cyclase/phosphodiesterase [Actinotalea sp. Marseille-Q4924]|uniref:putative bifunctional diguanylate cyclase/phosphodiesterase n=1 Tax=Actinotalea sp. Marseille-Q4924 TaxID=2866571 RepID=UPI001CE3F908|nr:bifunctional diguanylate cyclase/phosphodiesterase [Actinotalea sp. Marseille-Q4924]
MIDRPGASSPGAWPGEREPAEQLRVEGALDNVLDPVAVVRPVRDASGAVTRFVVVHANTPAVARGTAVGDEWVPPDDDAVSRPGPAALFHRYVQVLTGGTSLLLESLFVPTPDGDERYVDLRVVRLGDELLVTWRDVTAQLIVDRELDHSERRFRSAFDGAPVGMVILGLEPGEEGRILEANQTLADLVGRAPEDLMGRPSAELHHPDDLAAAFDELARMAAGSSSGFQQERRLRRADGGWAWVRVTASVVQREGSPSYVIEHVEDVTARRAAEAELAHRALYDALTGLGNRTLLMDHLRLAVGQLAGADRGLAVLVCDLDRFRDVNDTLGHTAGDEVLREMAQRLTETVPAPDTVARLSGDEFVVAMRVRDETEALRVARRLHERMSEPVEVRGFRLVVGPSIGVTTTSDPAADPEVLLREADLAMHQAKRAGRDRWVLYDETLHTMAVERLATEEALRHALDHGGFRLLFQPIVDVADGRVVSAEALLRLEHPVRGTLSPEAFIDVAEASDLIVPIGDWVLQEACRQLARWQARVPDMQVTVNVSTRQVSHLALADQLDRAARDSGADPARVLLEITEHVLLDAGDAAAGELARVTDAGSRLAIDDFGTGYASLAYLKRFPVSVVKIDRSFVEGLDRPGEDTAIVEAVIGLARTLGLQVVAEGVETAGQLTTLRRLGCTRVQGFHLGRPMTGDELAEVLDRSRTAGGAEEWLAAARAGRSRLSGAHLA